MQKLNHLSNCCCKWKATFLPSYLGAATKVVKTELGLGMTKFYLSKKRGPPNMVKKIAVTLQMNAVRCKKFEKIVLS